MMIQNMEELFGSKQLGKEFGDDGYVWIKYSDFKKYSREAYAFDVEFGKNFNYEFDDFERYGIKSGLYEGEYIDDKLNGYGSWYSKENKTYYLGYLKDGSWDGFHVIISPDEMKWVNLKMEILWNLVLLVNLKMKKN